MFCKNCGKKIDDDSVFCMYCGTKFNTMTHIETDKNLSVKEEMEDSEDSKTNEIYISDESEKKFNENGEVSEYRYAGAFWSQQFKGKETKKLEEKFEILGNEVVLDKTYLQQDIIFKKYDKLIDRLWRDAKLQYEATVITGSENSELELYIGWLANTIEKTVEETLRLMSKTDVRLTKEEVHRSLLKEPEEGDELQAQIHCRMKEIQQGVQFFVRNYAMIIGYADVEQEMLKNFKASSGMIGGGFGVKGAITGVFIGEACNYVINRMNQIRAQRKLEERQKLAMSRLISSGDTMQIQEHIIRGLGKILQVIYIQAIEIQGIIDFSEPIITINGKNFLNITEEEMQNNPILLAIVGTLMEQESEEAFDFLWQCCNGKRTKELEKYFIEFEMTSVLDKKTMEIYA